MKQLIECVPNISEGRDMNIINQVTAEIEKVEGVKCDDKPYRHHLCGRAGKRVRSRIPRGEEGCRAHRHA